MAHESVAEAAGLRERLLRDAAEEQATGVPYDSDAGVASSDDASSGDEPVTVRQLEAELARNATATRWGRTLSAASFRCNVFFRSVAGVVNAITQWGLLLSVLLLVFLVHQIFLWIDQDPEAAYSRAATVFQVAELTYDTSGVLLNAGIDVANAAVIPLWNSAAFYIAEPSITLLVEVFSLVFAQRHWEGLYSEADFPFAGLDCLSSATAATWCGRFSAYQARLEAAEKAPFFINESAYDYSNANADPGRRLGSAGLSPRGDHYTFSIGSARRLSELSGDGLFVTPTFDTEGIVEGLDSFSELFIVVQAVLTDLAFGVGYEVGSAAFSVVIDGFVSALKGLLGALRWLVKSGLFTTVRPACAFVRAPPPPPTPTHSRAPASSRAQLVNIGVEFLVLMGSKQRHSNHRRPSYSS